MGEDFTKRRNDRFFRRRDEHFAEQTGPDLFSAFAPESVVEVPGFAQGDVSSGQTLWAPEVSADGPITFFHGDSPVVTVEGLAADHVRACHTDGAVVAEVREVEQDHGLVMLRVGSRS